MKDKKWTKKRLVELQALEDLLIELSGLDNTTRAITKLPKLVKAAKEFRWHLENESFWNFLRERCWESIKVDGKYTAEINYFGKHVATIYADSPEELNELCQKFNNGLLDK